MNNLLNGGFNGLYGEVVLNDCYGLRQIDFIPDVVIDAGSNIGIFTRYARELFPDAFIVSIEPNADNYFTMLNITGIENWKPINAAIGNSQMWHFLGATNGSGESYVSSGIGFPHAAMQDAADNGNRIEKSEVSCITLGEAIKWHVNDKQKLLVKIDIEGGEMSFIDDEESISLLQKADYVCMEVHLYALTGGEMYETMAIKLGQFIGRLMTTHTIKLDGVHLWAKKHNF